MKTQMKIDQQRGHTGTKCTSFMILSKDIWTLFPDLRRTPTGILYPTQNFARLMLEITYIFCIYSAIVNKQPMFTSHFKALSPNVFRKRKSKTEFDRKRFINNEG